jgi:hypothetical protein
MEEYFPLDTIIRAYYLIIYSLYMNDKKSQ